MGAELEQAKTRVAEAATALEQVAAEAAPAVSVAPVGVTHEAVDLEPAARAAEHVSDNEVRMAEIASATAIEQAHIAAAIDERRQEAQSDVEARLIGLEERLAALEAARHEHHRAPRHEERE